MNKTLTILTAALLLTGIAAAQPQNLDIPEPGITPNSPLYMIEQFSEGLALGVAKAPVIGSEELESKVRANQAAERLAEARVMAERNNTQMVDRLMEQYTESMNHSIASAKKANRSELSKRLKNVTDNQIKVLEEVEKKVPEQAKLGIQRAIENNRRGSEALGRGKPEKLGKPSETGRDRGAEKSTERKNDAAGNRVTGKTTSSPTNPDRSGGSRDSTTDSGSAESPQSPDNNADGIGNGKSNEQTPSDREGKEDRP